MSAPPATSGSARAAELREAFLAGHRGLAALLPTSGGDAERGGLVLGRAHAGLLDELLTGLFDAVRDESRPVWRDVAVAGVGSYGRGAVALRSDLDVRVLARDASAAQEVADALLYPLWDMGVPVGHQVIDAAELCAAARDDLPSATSLLDWRHVAGDRACSEALRRRAEEGVFAHSELPRFMARLGDEALLRHKRFGGSVYLLEPDVKSGEGGLRDLDVARWAARARWGVADLDELVRVGGLVAREAAELAAAGELLWRIRNLLHAHAGRRSDRLTFDEQETIAPLLGYGDGPEAVERMMSDYYRHAQAVTRGLETLLSRATPILVRKKPRDDDLGGGVRMFDGAISIADPEALRADPALALRAVTAAVERGVSLLPWARDAVVRAAADVAFGAQLRARSDAARLFVDLVASWRETRLRGGSALRELHDTGLLLSMIPEFSPVVGRVHHDIYHVYTVDVHSVAAVDRLAALARGELAHQFPLASRLAAEIARPRMLAFATLLHDVGKAIGGRDHSERGAEMAGPILRRLGFSDADIDEACHLIREHLVMYHLATRRDVDDPATVDEFCRTVRGVEGLRDLYLLTVADLSTTSPTSMTSWKARMLDELYLATESALSGSSPRDQRVAAARSDALAASEALGGAAERAFAERFLASMPDRYLLANGPDAIAAHARVAHDHERGGPLVTVAVTPSRHPEAAELCVVAADRPGLLAAITAAIAASRLEVHAAQIHSRAGPAGVQAVDLFWVRDRGEGAAAVPRALPALQRDLEGVLSGAVDARELAGKRASPTSRERSTPGVKTRVSIDDRASGRHTVIEVVTRDRPGLLHTVADALFRLGLSIAVAKINTEGARVADVFYVHEHDGAKIATGPRAAQVERAILEALGEAPDAPDDARTSLPPAR